ncbi:protein TsetseEP-like [Glossina fuscipes]|uniref:Protein TsetseEP-like n=1 Tax=Glossina fuscipes TaxID=7396 RepID=A0A9C6DXD0_9MUSC|nr:protein TsetseEP-like [Glossina fuscipes]
MKFFISFAFLCLVLSCVAALSPDQVESRLKSYVEKRSFTLLRSGRVSRAGTNTVQCYDKYVPLIRQAAADGKLACDKCAQEGQNAREEETKKSEVIRESLNIKVSSIENGLGSCVAKYDVLEYFTCLRDHASESQTTAAEVGKTAAVIVEGLNIVLTNIDLREKYCTDQAFEQAQEKTDALFSELENCLVEGLPEPEPEPEHMAMNMIINKIMAMDTNTALYMALAMIMNMNMKVDMKMVVDINMKGNTKNLNENMTTNIDSYEYKYTLNMNMKLNMTTRNDGITVLTARAQASTQLGSVFRTDDDEFVPLEIKSYSSPINSPEITKTSK